MYLNANPLYKDIQMEKGKEKKKDGQKGALLARSRKSITSKEKEKIAKVYGIYTHRVAHIYKECSL